MFGIFRRDPIVQLRKDYEGNSPNLGDTDIKLTFAVVGPTLSVSGLGVPGRRY